MELRQLLSFMEIAKCENLSQAAANLYISQPALSKQIQNLESELNTKLFRRNLQRYVSESCRTMPVEILP